MIRLSDDYALWAYELGFEQGSDPRVDAPCRSQCCGYYWLGFHAARR